MKLKGSHSATCLGRLGSAPSAWQLTHPQRGRTAAVVPRCSLDASAGPGTSLGMTYATLEFEHLYVSYVRQCTELVLDGVGHDLVDTDNCNRVLLRRLAAQMEGGDIDVGLRQ
jgi:hypothetical protein